jgi:hypothetical protein
MFPLAEADVFPMLLSRVSFSQRHGKFMIYNYYVIKILYSISSENVKYSNIKNLLRM